MHPFKKFLLTILIILALVSIFQDLSKIDQEAIVQETVEKQLDYTIVPVKIMPGDTVLSVIENLHDSNKPSINIDMLLSEFRQLNPTTAPTDIKVGHIYYFPVINE